MARANWSAEGIGTLVEPGSVRPESPADPDAPAGRAEGTTPVAPPEPGVPAAAVAGGVAAAVGLAAALLAVLLRRRRS